MNYNQPAVANDPGSYFNPLDSQWQSQNVNNPWMSQPTTNVPDYFATQTTTMQQPTPVTTNINESFNKAPKSKSSAENKKWINVIILLLVLLAIWILAMTIFMFYTRSQVTNNQGWNIVYTANTAVTFTPNGNDILEFTGNVQNSKITVGIPSTHNYTFAPNTGRMFIIDNTYNSNSVTVMPNSSVSMKDNIQSGIINGNTSATYIWEMSSGGKYTFHRLN